MEYFQIIISILFIISVFSWFSLAPWVPTRSNDLERIHKLVSLKKNQKFLEIGCGNARVSLYLARHNSNAVITGIEFSPLMYIISLLRVKYSRLKNIKIIYGNALKLNLNNYDVLYVFGLPETVTRKIFPKLKKEMKPTAHFYSYCFQMTNDYFSEIKHKPNSKINAIYEYSSK